MKTIKDLVFWLITSLVVIVLVALAAAIVSCLLLMFSQIYIGEYKAAISSLIETFVTALILSGIAYAYTTQAKKYFN